jgi:hypothetical protein
MNGLAVVRRVRRDGHAREFATPRRIALPYKRRTRVRIKPDAYNLDFCRF